MSQGFEGHSLGTQGIGSLDTAYLCGGSREGHGGSKGQLSHSKSEIGRGHSDAVSASLSEISNRQRDPLGPLSKRQA